MSTMGNIDIQPAALRGLADQIASQRQNLDARLQDVANQMQALKRDGWQSESGDRLQARFNNLRSYYNSKYPPAMQSYIEFLRATADEYEQNEARRKAAVENLSNMGQA